MYDMSNRSIVWIIVILVILIGAYLLMNRGAQDNQPNQPTATDTSGQEISSSTSTSATVNNTSPMSELIKEDLKVGEGQEAKKGDTITVNYVGTLTDGKKFDSSYDREESFSFTLGAGEVIEGWDEGVVGMKVGGKRKLIIPGAMAYGDYGRPPVIPPNATLIFEVELVSIDK